MTEHVDAHDAVLQWCRSNPAPHVHPVMRTSSHDGQCKVIDVGRDEPKPDGYDWERRSRVLASGPNWSACADALGILYRQGAE